jgi:pimeloyl-ACP methyl ester carboxylesterase
MGDKGKGQSGAPAAGARRRIHWRWIVAALVGLLGVTAAAYFGVCGYVATQLTKPARHDQVATPADFGLAFEDTEITARDGLKLAGWFVPHAESERAVLVVHGQNKCRSCEFDDRFMEFAARLHAGGFNLLMIDLRGHGQSEGERFTLGDHERRDVLGALDWLVGRGFERIGVVGVSLGAAGSVGAASDAESGHVVKALVIDSSFSDLSEFLRVRFTKESGLPGVFFPGSLFMARVLVRTNPYAVNPVEDLPHVEAPVLVIYGGQDDIVPLDQLQAMADVRPDAETWFVEEAAHARVYNAQPEQYVSRVTQFLDEALR